MYKNRLQNLQKVVNINKKTTKCSKKGEVMNQKEVIQNTKVEEFKIKAIQNRKVEVESKLKFIDDLTADIVVLDYSIEDLLIDLCELREGLETELEIIKKTPLKQEC